MEPRCLQDGLWIALGPLWVALAPLLAALRSILAVLRWLLVSLGDYMAALACLERSLWAFLVRLGSSWGLSDAPGPAPGALQGVALEGLELLGSAQAQKPLPVYMYIRLLKELYGAV